MLSNRRQHRYLRVGVLIFVALFAVTTVACAGLCQMKAQQNGHSLLPLPGCHVAGAIDAGPMLVHIEPLSAFFHGVAAIVPAMLIRTIFHPPHA